MSLRRHACLPIALFLVSAACSGPTRDGGDAAAPTSTGLPTIPGSIHDTVPPPGSASSVGSSTTTGRAVSGSGGTTTTTRRGTVTTTTASGSRSSTTTTPTTVPPGLPPEKCPEPKTCRRYGFHTDTPARWPASVDGIVRIPYRINPSGATSITPERIEGAIRAAFDTWERAAPTVRFEYKGRTDKPAATGDGVNVVGFNGPTIESTSIRADKNGNFVEFDMLYGPNGWTWAPCTQADDSCTPTSGNQTGPVTDHPFDLQSIATHAAGHALWLGDMEDEALDRHLTMSPTFGPPGDRQKTTLALGDVLGVRALYPCSCPLPPIYDP